MFPICMLAIVYLGFGLAVGYPIEVGEPADPFATPLEILPEWFLLPAFEILRAVPNKLLGIGGMLAIPFGLSLVPFLEASNPQRAMNVKKQSMFPSIPRQGRVRCEATGNVVVHVVALDLARLGLGFVERFGNEQESIAPIVVKREATSADSLRWPQSTTTRNADLTGQVLR